jgi:hypothetical protein
VQWTRPIPGRHRSVVLEGTPRPARLAPGDYACLLVDDFFKPCAVATDADGFTWIDAPRSALGLRGVAFDDGPTLVIEGSSSHERPFGCYRTRFDVPEELEPEASRECVEQPMVLTLVERDGTWSGTLPYAVYKKRLAPAPPSSAPTAVPRPNVAAPGWTVRRETFRVVIGPASMVGTRLPK